MKVHVILASASPRRKELLSRIFPEFEIRPAEGKEETQERDPGKRVEALSRLKAMEAAAGISPGTVVIGADTMVFCRGQALGKPENEEEAGRMLRLLQGNTHQVCTGVTLAWREAEGIRRHSFHESTDVSVYPMTDGEILAYIETGEPMDKAGAYGIQGDFARYIRGIRGDYTNVVGLPVGRLYQELKGISGALSGFPEADRKPAAWQNVRENG